MRNEKCLESRRWIWIFLVWMVMGAVALRGQDEGAETPSAPELLKDPFLKEASGGAPADYGKRDPYAEVAAEAAAVAREPERVIAVSSEFIEVPREKWIKVMAADEGDPLDGTTLRKEVQKWLEAGEAAHVGGGMTVARSGQRASVQSVQEFLYPTETQPYGPNARFPAAFETLLLGHQLEVDPQIYPEKYAKEGDLGDEGKGGWPKIGLAMVSEMGWYAGEYRYGYEPDALLGEPLVIEPIFRFFKSTNQVIMASGEYRLMDAFSWTNEDGAPLTESKVLSFVRADIVELEPTVGQKSPPKRAQAVLKFEWIEVDSDWWAGWLLDHEGSSFILTARAAVEELLDERRASIMEVLHLPMLSGQRQKSESKRFMVYPTEWIPAEEVGMRSERTASEPRNLGVTVEVDPALGPGGYADVNLVPEIVTHVGENVHQRIEVDGEWVPDVTMPLFYEMKTVTSVTLSLNQAMLISVMAPADEVGFPDGERRVLLFLTVRR